MRPDVSIVIVNWNTRELLGACLESLYRETKTVSFEVIVVDNGSADGSRTMVRSMFPQVILIANVGNRGFAAANNQALAVATGRYVLLLNSDTNILERAVDRTIAFADAHPAAGVVGCRLLNPNGTLQHSCMLFPSLLSLVLSCAYLSRVFPRSRFFGRADMTWWPHDDVREVDVVKGCFLLVRRQVVEQVGHLDERFWLFAEETDWCYRIKQAGWKIMFTPSCEIVHVGGASTRKVSRVLILQLWGSILLFVRKHRSYPYYLLCCTVVSMLFASRILPCLAVGLVKPQRRDEMFDHAIAYAEGLGRLMRHGVSGLLHLRGISSAPEPE